MTIIIALDKLNSTRSNVVKSVIKLHTRINICRHEPHKVHVKLRLTSLWITQLRRVFHRASVRDRENLITSTHVYLWKDDFLRFLIVAKCYFVLLNHIFTGDNRDNQMDATNSTNKFHFEKLHWKTSGFLDSSLRACCLANIKLDCVS